MSELGGSAPGVRPWLALLLVAGVLVAAPSHARATRSRWSARLTGQALLGVDDRVTFDRAGTLPAESVTHSASDGSGLGVGLEYRSSERYGIELSALLGDLDTALDVRSAAGSLVESRQVSIEAYTLGINYYFQPRERFRLSVGLFGGLYYFEDLLFFAGTAAETKLTFDDDLGLGLQLNVEIPIGSRDHWSFVAGLRAVKLLMESEVPGQDLDLNPIVPTAGIGYRF